MHFKVLEAQKYRGFFIQIYIFCMSGKQCQSYRSPICSALVPHLYPLSILLSLRRIVKNLKNQQLILRQNHHFPITIKHHF